MAVDCAPNSYRVSWTATIGAIRWPVTVRANHRYRPRHSPMHVPPCSDAPDSHFRWLRAERSGVRSDLCSVGQGHLMLCAAQDSLGGFQQRAVRLIGRYGHRCGRAQHQDRQTRRRPARHHQDRRPTTTTDDRHEALIGGRVAGQPDLVSERIKIRGPFQACPVDRDVGDRSQRRVEGCDEFGKLVGDDRGMRPPCPIDQIARFFSESQPDGRGSASLQEHKSRRSQERRADEFHAFPSIKATPPIRRKDRSAPGATTLNATPAVLAARSRRPYTPTARSRSFSELSRCPSRRWGMLRARPSSAIDIG